MRPYLAHILAFLCICVSSCRKELPENPVEATSLVCSSTDLISLSHELRHLSPNATITLASVYAYLERDNHCHWKLTDDTSSFDSGSFTFASNDWKGVEIQGNYHLENRPDPASGRIGTISDLKIVLNDDTSTERRATIVIMQDGAYCW